jgi:two-component system, sensor histidine kinase and response regulator
MTRSTVARVLLAEDDPVSQRVMRTLLEAADCRVRIVEDGPAAVDAASAARFDLIILDYHMPGLDACAVARAINAALGPHAPPILGISASVGEVRELCLNAGMVAVMGKPIQRDDLIRIVRTYALGVAPAIDSVPSSAGCGRSPFEYEALLGQLGGNAGLLRKLLERYREVTPAYCDAIREALRARDSKAIASAAHRMKGAAASAGASLVSQVAGALEAMAHAGETRGLPDLFTNLEERQREFLEAAAAYQSAYHAGTKSPGR